MLDKLELRIPAGTPFAKDFEIGSELLRGAAFGFSPTRFYTLSGDLRGYGHDALLHLGHRFGNHNHKLEFVSSGTKTFSELLEGIKKIWDVDPLTLTLMRADLAVDIPHIPVPWFREHARFKHKQFASQLDKANDENEAQFVTMGSAISQTLYAGKRPNLIRIYNKREEWLKQWRREVCNVKRFNRRLKGFDFSPEQIEEFTQTPPTFEEFCRAKDIALPPGQVLTRVERQIGGDRVPPQLDTVAKLRELQYYKPFENVEFLASPYFACPGPPGSETGRNESIRDHLAGIGFQQICKQRGSVQAGVAYVTKHGKGNGKRVLDSIRPYWPVPDAAYKLTTEQLNAEFCKSAAKQLAVGEPCE